MSTLKVNNLTDLGADAVVTDGVIAASALPAGSILQVVSTTKTDTFTTTSTSYTGVTDLTASITPSSASNKIMVMINASVGATNDSTAHLRAARDGSPVNVGDSSGSVVQSAVSIYGRSSVDGGAFTGQHGSSITFLDSPATTSSVTYTVELRTGNLNGAVYVGRAGTTADSTITGRTPSNITLMEVAG